MESYEKIRKMGEISKQLKQHGLVEDNTEALKKAEDLMMDKSSEFYVTQEKMKKNVEKAEACCNDANVEIKKLSLQVNDKVAALDSQVALIRDKMNEIIAKLNELESKIDSQPRQEVQATLAVQKEEPKPEPKKQESKHKVNPEVKKEYSSDDVAVDKMFYVGSK